MSLVALFLISAARQTSVDGTWEGAVSITTPDNQVQHASGMLWLSLKDGIGALGDGPEHLTSVRNVRAGSEGCEFDFVMRGKTFHFKTKRSAAGLEGTGIESGAQPFKITLDFHASSVQPLYATIAEKDHGLFAAFNARELSKLSGYFAKDLEFYHDKDGLVGYAKMMDSFQKHFREPTKVKRVLDPDSLDISPVKGYGAIETGIHRFYSMDPGKDWVLTATAKFVNVWKLDHGRWQITRACSYDHE